MRSFVRPQLALGFALMALASCSGAHPEAVAIFGQLRTEAGAGIAGAQVCAAAKNTCVTTDASGNYALPFDNTIVDPVVVQFSSSGYARKTLRMHNTTISQAGVVLRAIDTQSLVTLPAAGADPVVVEAVHDDSRSSLVIGPGALVDPNGVPAAGNANVSLTYFHPLQNLQAVPGALNAEDGNGIKGIFTYGMADIEIEQNGALLAVAPNQTLGWNILEPDNVVNAMSPSNDYPAPTPDLYSLNANTGLWHLEGTAATGAVSFDANSRTVMTRLPHLSGWNVDADASPTYGGCVSGRIVDPCGKPIAGKAITVWFLGLEQLKDWTGTVTGSDGRFCTPTYLSSFNANASPPSTGINYFVAGADSPGDTSMCNPAPAQCFNCIDQSPPYSTMGWCTNCFLDPTQSQKPNTGTEAPTYYTNSCNAPRIDLVVRSFCDTGGCNDLGDITLNSSSCSKQVGSGSSNAPTPPDPCAKGGSGKQLGEACSPTDVCCPSNSAPLVCEDHLCLPPTDK